MPVKLLDEVSGFLKKRPALAKDRTCAKADLELQAATAILLLEAGYGDADYVWKEERAIVKGLEREFGLGKKEVRELLDRAYEVRPPVVKLADVTGVIRDRYNREQRSEVLRLIWGVIHADGVVEEWEESFADHIGKAVGLTGKEAHEARDASRA
jgi:uncharacterized tellurite resistance protein B-like protein